jgi:hypothetical protein
MTRNAANAAHHWPLSELLTDKDQALASALDPHLLEAYWRTDYRVIASEPIIMRLGTRSAAMDGLLTTQDARFALFVTAWNPGSRPLSVLENAARQAEMIRGLQIRNARWLDAVGADETGEWPAEESVFILDATVLMADRLMTEWDQNAAVWVEHGKPPALVLHPRFRRAAMPRVF